MRDALMRLLEPPVEASGYELVDLEYARHGRGAVLRLFIDRPPRGGGPGDAGVEHAQEAAPAGVTVEDCARVSHAVSRLLDVEDPIKGSYTLEVSSPGADRILRKREHFERFVGERVFVELKLPIEGRRRFAGVLRSVTGDSIVVESDGQAHSLPLERIQKARLRPG